jgi:hypothetical protein
VKEKLALYREALVLAKGANEKRVLTKAGRADPPRRAGFR